jgi:hypothetical protein
VPDGSSWSIEHFLRTMRSRVLPKPQPLEDEQRQEREDTRSRLDDDLEEMRGRHTQEDGQNEERG